MSGGYINLDKDLRDDPRTLVLADLYTDLLERDVIAICGNPVDKQRLRDVLRGVARNAVVGALAGLWAYADTHIHEDNALSVTPVHLAQLFLVPIELIQQMPPEWLNAERPGTTVLPDYRQKNFVTAREHRRMKGRERSARFRERHKPTTDVARDPALASTVPVTSVTAESNTRNDDTRAGARARVSPSQSYSDSPNPLTRGPGSGNGPSNGAGSRTVRDLRKHSLEAWRIAALTVDEIRANHGSWADAQQRIGELAHQAIERIGGYRLIADRTRYSVKELRERFRAAYEQVEQTQRGDKHVESH